MGTWLTLVHCCVQFALNGNPENPDCDRVDGILRAYVTALQNVRLFGPTNFGACVLEDALAWTFCDAVDKGSGENL